MIGTSHVTAVARLIRVTTATFAVALVVAYVSVQIFASHYSVPPTTQVVVAESVEDAELAAAISEQMARGMTCREEPALTDTILFQELDQTEVHVLTFEQATAASSAREGWIRRYCF